MVAVRLNRFSVVDFFMLLKSLRPLELSFNSFFAALTALLAAAPPYRLLLLAVPLFLEAW